MAAGNAQFVYSVPETPWHVVITDTSRHFYFNSATKAAVWQITDTDGQLSEKIDWDRLAVLFAKSRGWAPQKKPLNEKQENSKKQEERIPEREAENEPEEDSESEEYVQPEVPHDLIGSIVAESGPLEEEKREDENEEDEKDEGETHRGGLGLLQGYGSDSDEGNDSEEGSLKDEVESLKSDGEDADINAGLELGLLDDEDQDSSKTAFKELLSQHKSAFSIYDPWFLVAEELVTVLAQEPAFYSLLDETKEAVFNEWVAEADGNGTSKSSTFPTPTLLYYQAIQEHKSEIRKLPYVQFKEQFPIDSDVEEPDKLYRALRATLVDFAEHEKALKKGGYKGENLKVRRVADFVALETKELNLVKEEYELQAELFFDKWMDLCNHFDLPRETVESPVNFILGDEKRYFCYKDAFR